MAHKSYERLIIVVDVEGAPASGKTQLLADLVANLDERLKIEMNSVSIQGDELVKRLASAKFNEFPYERANLRVTVAVNHRGA